MIYDLKTEDLNTWKIYNPLLNKKQLMEIEKMKKKTEKAFKLEDGKHEGTIKSVEYTEKKSYEYVDIQIEEKESQLVLRYGVPFSVTENTALGQLIERFGEKLEIDKECDVNNDVIKYGEKVVLKAGMKVEFQTMVEKTDRGTFSKIITPTLVPKK